MEFNSKVKTTLNYLRTLLDLGEDSAVTITFSKDYVYEDFGDGDMEEIKINTYANPIGDMINSINTQMCVDCLEIDYLYKNEFFLDLVRAYVQTLIHEFGDRVPISSALAKAALQYNLLPQYTIWCHHISYSGLSLPLDVARKDMDLSNMLCYLTTY